MRTRSKAPIRNITQSGALVLWAGGGGKGGGEDGAGSSNGGMVCGGAGIGKIIGAGTGAEDGALGSSVLKELAALQAL